MIEEDDIGGNSNSGLVKADSAVAALAEYIKYFTDTQSQFDDGTKFCVTPWVVTHELSVQPYGKVIKRCRQS
jgi:hypothetical protein